MRDPRLRCCDLLPGLHFGPTGARGPEPTWDIVQLHHSPGAAGGVAPAGAEISTRPFQLVTGRRWIGSAFGGARGRTDVPKIVDWYMDGKINIDALITHTMPLEQINHGFELMERGESIRSVVMF